MARKKKPKGWRGESERHAAAARGRKTAKREPTVLPGPKYPEVGVRLVGEDGNAFAILGRVSGAMRRAGIRKSEIDAFIAEATSGDYDSLLATVMRWVEIE